MYGPVGSWVVGTWPCVFTLLLICCKILDKFLHLSGPLSSHLQSGVVG